MLSLGFLYSNGGNITVMTINENSNLYEAYTHAEQLYNLLETMLQYDSTLKTEQDVAQSTLIGDEESMYKRERAYVGDDPNGKPIYKWAEGNNQRELQKAIAFKQFESGIMWEWLQEWAESKGMPLNLFGGIQPVPVQNAQQEEKTSTPFDAFAWDWLERYIHGIKSETYYNTMKSRVKNACVFFSCSPIEKITVDDVQDYLNSNAENSRDTINRLKICLGQILDVAMEKGIIEKNPTKAKCISVIGLQTDGSKPLTGEQYEDVTSHIPMLENPTERMFLGLALYAGLRREEILGLRWEHIDFDNNSISIEQALTYPGGKATVKCPKTKASKATIPLFKRLRPILEPQRKSDGFVITNTKGGIFKFQTQYDKFYKDMSEHINLYGRTCRDFRPSFSNDLRRKGIDLKINQRLMRHEKADITANVYLKTYDEEVWKCCEAI